MKMFSQFLIVISVILILFGLSQLGDDKEFEKNYSSSSSSSSVNNYIFNSKLSAFVDIADGYVSVVRTRVNEGKKLKLFNDDTLYMIPVGNKTDSCYKTEYGGKSPFSDTWKYAFVGVIFDSTTFNYKYFAVFEDDEKYGIPFVSQNDLYTKANEIVFIHYDEQIKNGNYMTKDFSNYLAEIYTKKENIKHIITDDEKEIFKSNYISSKIDKIVYVMECSYSN